jgi:hypothetical protein
MIGVKNICLQKFKIMPGRKTSRHHKRSNPRIALPPSVFSGSVRCVLIFTGIKKYSKSRYKCGTFE